MCFSFSSPTNLAQKIKNSRLSFIFLHFLNNQTHKITQIYKIKRHAHKNFQNTKTFNNYTKTFNKIFLCFETKHKNTKTQTQIFGLHAQPNTILNPYFLMFFEKPNTKLKSQINEQNPILETTNNHKDKPRISS